MSIPETFHFDKGGEVVRFPALRKYFLTLLIALIALLSFGIGRLTGDRGEGRGVSINYDPNLASASVPVPSSLIPITSSAVYASAKGTKYYYTHCKSTVSEKNKVTFATAAEAEKAGYTLAANCQP